MIQNDETKTPSLEPCRLLSCSRLNMSLFNGVFKVILFATNSSETKKDPFSIQSEDRKNLPGPFSNKKSAKDAERKTFKEGTS